MRLSYRIVMVLCLVLAGAPILAQEQKPIAASKSDAGVVYFLRNHNLWVHDLKSGQDRQITQDKKISTYTVSHSGNQIAYVLDDGQLYILDLIENKETFLIKKTSLADPSFSPKDDQIVFTCSVKKEEHFLSNTFGFVYHLWLMDVQTKKATDLTVESPYHHNSASWSPDGKFISYSAMANPWWTMFKDVPWEIYLMNVDDKKDLAIKIGKGSNSIWIDSKRLVISADRLFKVYDVQTRTVVKEFKIDDPYSEDCSFEPTLETIYCQAFCGGEGEQPVVKIFDVKTRTKKELISSAEHPLYVK
jgi:dipeptidyl aminopeptidase/acylaminoacyl peptidase